MRIKKRLVSAAVLFGMAALFVPAVSAASVPTDGTGTVIENTTTDASQREFFTIKTPDGNVFYVVVDKTKTDDNVYLLTPVTEDSLKALAESAAQKNSVTGTTGTSSSLFGSLSGTSSGTTGTASETDGGSSASGSAAKATAAKSAASKGNIAFLVLVVLAVFGAAYYFKIYKPKHARPANSYEAEPDEPDEQGGGSGANEGTSESEEATPPAPAPQPVTERTAPRPEPSQVQPEQARSEQAQPAPAREAPADRQEPENQRTNERESNASITPRPRREDARAPEEVESERLEPHQSVSPQATDNAPVQQEQPQPAPRQQENPTFNPPPAQGNGLLAPDPVKSAVPPPVQKTASIPYEQEEPEDREEPEPDDEDVQDYEDGTDPFDYSGEEDT
ncbi:MAG: DUF4366 domain-containing protein [Ethanoligenens sp.]